MLRPHRRPRVSLRSPGLQSTNERKRRMRNAVRRGRKPPQLALRRAPCRARSPSGVPPRLCPRDSRIPRCNFGPGFAGQAPRWRGSPAGTGPGYSEAPRMPVIMPADMMSEAAREQPAKPSAGAVLARCPGLPPGHLLHEGEDHDLSQIGTMSRTKVTEKMIDAGEMLRRRPWPGCKKLAKCLCLAAPPDRIKRSRGRVTPV